MWKEKLVKRESLKKLSQDLKKQNKSIVTLNGSFDLLHAGHLYIIEEAKKQGDVLIVALNSDESIHEYKGKDRPIIPLCYRMQMMAALASVDYVTSFSETDPRNILKLIAPHVHVNGGEYGPNCIEKEVVESLGGRIYLVERISTLSTSEIIKKIQKCGI